MAKAVFFDRDGVLNRLVFNPATGSFESPHTPDDWALMPGVLDALKRLRQAGFELFLVTNQPSYAKGKTTLENIKAIHARLHAQLTEAGIMFSAYYYCYHHPDGIVPDYSGPCECRKPSPYFLKQAQKAFGLDMAASWMIGDQDTDIACGQAAGVRTIQIKNPDSLARRGMQVPDFAADHMADAVDIVLREGGNQA